MGMANSGVINRFFYPPYISANVGSGKVKIAIMLMPFQLHLRRSHDRILSLFRFIGLRYFLGLICGNSPVHDPNLGNQSSYFDFAENINLRGQK